ncbi:MAG: MFS transporter [Candidatus Gastranaerophilales bacterium]|nr:MFS transporter [Candidatus Gastranaerophilales bacterium]
MQSAEKIKKLSIPDKGIFNKLVGFFKEPDAIEQIQDREVIKKTYAHWRLRTFTAIFIAYVVFYLCKKNISVALPVMGIELGYSNTQLGLLGGTLYFTYAIGKFVNGIMADRSNVRVFLPVALMVSAIANICLVISSFLITPGHLSFFGLPSATVLLWIMAFFWGCNGWFQSMGFPAIAKSLSFWYSNKERGTIWSFWSTSHESGTFLSVILSGFLIAKFGWQSAFYIPAILAIVISLLLYSNLRDKPTSIGLPEVETYREPEVVAKTEDNDKNLTYREIFKKHILFNKTIWLLAIAYVFVYIIRFGTQDWIVKYLIEIKKNSLETAAMKLSVLPLCGIVGTLCAGFLSDKVFKGQRAPINVIYLTGIMCSLLALKFNTIGTLDYLYIGALGAFTYGPQVLIGGLCAIESSSKKVASAATGFTGSFGYLGAILSSIGTGIAIDKFQWDGAIYFWVASAFLCALICLIIWHDEKYSKTL